ncbi:hypothetical protein CWI81_06670 [Idiomarina seosinensis]|uniref:Uncharacterized protein n=1 Tax=Idiomarina seosinensis TaxID=281739 RepID=A0A432ZCW0_9GAMM|nr:hypothetical protein CWI81_06670 [Idiomarina seosinensis]
MGSHRLADGAKPFVFLGGPIGMPLFASAVCNGNDVIGIGDAEKRLFIRFSDSGWRFFFIRTEGDG